MIAIVKGFDDYRKEDFTYTIENIVNVQYMLGQILLTYVKDEKVMSQTYTPDSLKDGTITIY